MAGLARRPIAQAYCVKEMGQKGGFAPPLSRRDARDSRSPMTRADPAPARPLRNPNQSVVTITKSLPERLSGDSGASVSTMVMPGCMRVCMAEMKDGSARIR
jgi:hypothetical protein